MSIANILFYIYNGRMFVTNTNTIKKYFWYFQCMKAVTSVNSSDGFSSIVVNSALLAMNIFNPSQKVRREHFPPKKNQIFNKNNRYFRQTYLAVTNVLIFDE